MLNFEVDEKQAASVEVRKGNKNGKDWTMRSQPCWCHVKGSRYPIELVLNLPDDVQSYPKGEYSLELEALVIQGNFNRLAIDERHLRLSPKK